MKKRHIIIIFCIVLIPVFIGIFLSNTSNGDENLFTFEKQQKKIGLVKIYDIIYSSDEYVEQLRQLRKDNSIAGVILRINSPGGGVAPSQEIFEEVMRYKDIQKPIVVSMGNVAASGGYYIASPAKKIFACPGTITGSIGVIFQFPHYYKLLDKIGINMTTLKCGEYKDVGNPNRELTEKEKKYLQNLLDNTYQQFIDDVSIARNIDKTRVRNLAEGRIYTGKQAKEAGLVDSLGGYQVAVSYLKKILDLPEKTKIIEKKSQPGFLKEILSENLERYLPAIKKYEMSAGCYFLLQNF